MLTVQDIINRWPSPSVFAEDLGLLSAVHARTMRTRGSIPRGYWQKLLETAKVRNIEVTESDLSNAHLGKRQAGATSAIASRGQAA